MHKIPTLTLGIMLAIACVAASGCISSGGEDADIRYGGQYYPEEFVLDGDKTIWDMFGVAVDHTLFSSGAEGNEALIAGRVDINVGADSKTIALFNAIPDDAVIIGTTQRGNRYTTIVPINSTIISWEDLVGKTVAIRLGTGAESVLRKYFGSEGYEWEDYNWVNMKIEDMTAALEGGQIAAFTAWEPIPGIAEAQGVGKVMRTYGDVSLVPVSIHTTAGFIESHRDEIVRFLAAQIYKAELIRLNPEKAAEIATRSAANRGIKVSTEAFMTIFERIDFTIAFDEEIIASINETAQFLFDEGKINDIPPIVWDTSLVEEAQALLDSMGVSYE